MTAAGPARDLVVFRLHDELYALPLGSVREIIRYTPPTATAAVSGLVQGLINLRGRVLPIADLSSRLGRRLEVGRTTRILVVEVKAGELGLIVDHVEGVRAVPAAQIGPVPVAAGEGALGEEIAALDERLVILIDPERALGGILKAPDRPRRTSSRARPAGARPAAAPQTRRRPKPPAAS